MSKSSSVFVRVEPQIKDQAEAILNELGIPMSNAISLFLRQVVLQRGIPFEMKLPEAKPIVFGSLSDEEFNMMMEKGVADYASGNVTDATELKNKMSKGLGI